MSSSIVPSSRRANRVAALALLVLAPSAAWAQALPGVGSNPPPSPFVASPAPSQLPPGFPQGFGSQAPAAPESRPLPKGASIGDAGERVRALSAEGTKNLDQLVGDAVTKREKADVEALTERKRRIMLLEDTLKEAKLAKAIHEELNGKDSEKESAAIKKLEEEKAKLEQQLRDSTQPSALQAKQADPPPVVSAINGGPGGTVATILVPYSGVVYGKVGTVLPNGMKVVSISRNGVVVDQDGVRTTLALGDFVPRVRTPAVQGVPGQPPSFATPIGSGPGSVSIIR